MSCCEMHGGRARMSECGLRQHESDLVTGGERGATAAPIIISLFWATLRPFLPVYLSGRNPILFLSGLRWTRARERDHRTPQVPHDVCAVPSFMRHRSDGKMQKCKIGRELGKHSSPNGEWKPIGLDRRRAGTLLSMN